jgi:hypothetical protein
MKATTGKAELEKLVSSQDHLIKSGITKNYKLGRQS